MSTVTFSYTTAFWSWEDWELQLDWMALRGINLPLAWVGYEKTLVDVLQETGLTHSEISTFLSGPAFQAWNRFGNIQGSWGGDLPYSWIDGQFEMQKKIVARMVELGMTPVLPAFTGFVPHAITRVLPNASVVNGSQWNGFPPRYTHDTFLEPFDEHFPRLQKSFMSKQQAAYGDVTNIYTLDQYNELHPYSGNTSYLHNTAKSTMASLKGGNPDAIWMMQGWLFYYDRDFWSDDRVEAYLSGVEDNSDMLILDLYSESEPQWQRTHDYYGKPWIWCMLHDYGGNMGLYGQIKNITENPIYALQNSETLVGFGLTPEAQEGNEVIYDLLLQQAWSQTPVDPDSYFHDWVTPRYAGSGSIPDGLYHAWGILERTAYENTNASYAQSVVGSISTREPGLKLSPTTVPYDPQDLVQAWKYIYDAGNAEPALWENPSYQYDLVDVSRQVIVNAFIPIYTDLVSKYSQSADISSDGKKLINLLRTLDSVLSTNGNFRLERWIDSALAWAQDGNKSEAEYYEYNARNQITLWGPNGEISDYAAKEWGGLVSSYYVPRWEMFLDYIQSTPMKQYNATAFHDKVMNFELKWQHDHSVDIRSESSQGLENVLKEVVKEWPDIFMRK